MFIQCAVKEKYCGYLILMYMLCLKKNQQSPKSEPS